MFTNYLFRASQASKLLTGTIGLTEVQKRDLHTLLERKKGYENDSLDEKKKPYKALTGAMEVKLEKLLEIEKNPELPKGLKTTLKKLFRSEKFNRNFLFTNKYVVKGIMQEEDAITIYQRWTKKTKGVNRLFNKNTVRHTNKYFTGEPDIEPFLVNDILCGVDTKCSWSLESFPLNEEELIIDYECQNQVYMALTGAEMWITAYVLVNATEHLLNNEKQKYYKLYPGAVDNPDDPNYEELVKKLKDVDKMLIFDYDAFVERYGDYALEYTRKEWMEEGNDIPLSERVVEKVSYKDEKFMLELENRAKISREYMNRL